MRKKNVKIHKEEELADAHGSTVWICLYDLNEIWHVMIIVTFCSSSRSGPRFPNEGSILAWHNYLQISQHPS